MAARNQIATMIKNCMSAVLHIDVTATCREITIELFKSKLEKADNKEYLHENSYRVCEDMHIGFFDNQTYKVSQYIISEGCKVPEFGNGRFVRRNQKRTVDRRSSAKRP